MTVFLRFVCLAIIGAGIPGLAPGEAQGSVAAGNQDTPLFYWRDLSISGTADLSTLFCHIASDPEFATNVKTNKEAAVKDVPVVAVLRDTLGDSNPENDRLTYLWLLTYERPEVRQRLLSAVPFFYWHPSEGPNSAHQRDTKPLLNLAEPEHAMLSDLGRDLLQWTTLDPSVTAVRATSRMYRTNELDHERLRIEESISYLRQAPASEGRTGLTRAQIDTVIARLELRKKLLGALVTEREATHLGEQVAFEQQQIRSRNWELLRQCAEKTGLVFEPLRVGGTSGAYAMLWFPLDTPQPPSGTSLAPVWKLLGMRNPWNESRLRHYNGVVFPRAFDPDGALLPRGEGTGKQVNLVPLAVYSLNYAKVPLLMMDFRDGRHVRWHEMTQRSINEVTAGVIGISHFTNWYYYVGADLYDFYVGRHGAAVDQAARLDCYSEFRVDLSMDTHLDLGLRNQMREHVESLEINPLESNPRVEIAAAWARYEQLEEDTRANGRLLRRIDRDRRQELAAFRETGAAVARDRTLHELSLGLYTHRAKRSSLDLETLDSYRRAQYQLAFLDSLVKAGTQPEVAYEPSKIQNSISELTTLLPALESSGMRAHATATIANLKQLSLDDGLQANCEQAMASIRRGTKAGIGAGGLGGAPGMAFQLPAPERLHRP